MKEKALVICPGRGTYNASELGYLARYHADRQDIIATLDGIRREAGQPTLSELDSAEKYAPSLHMTGDNASLMIYGCALADFAAIDRDRFDIVAITGNSMGWYLALACAGILDFEAGARLVNHMGVLMHQKGAGGQIIWSVVDDDWRVDPAKLQIADDLLAEATANPDIEVYVSIRLGGMIVFAADDAGLKWLNDRLPKDDRFPMRLMHHAAFHSPILDHILPLAQVQNPVEDFDAGLLPAIDGTGRVWGPKAHDRDAIYGYTLGAQINRTYDFTRAVQVAAAEYAPDRIIVLGPGTTLGAPVAQSLIQSHWRGLSDKADFLTRQGSEPFLLSMGMPDQRKLATG